MLGLIGSLIFEKFEQEYCFLVIKVLNLSPYSGLLEQYDCVLAVLDKLLEFEYSEDNYYMQYNSIDSYDFQEFYVRVIRSYEHIYTAKYKPNLEKLLFLARKHD